MKHKLLALIILLLLLVYPSRQAIAAWTSANFDRSVYGAAYGMVCNGVIDDTVAFQNAVNAVGTAGSQNRLVLPPGNCIISSTITFGNTVNYFVTGSGTGNISTQAPTILSWTGNSTSPMILLNATQRSTFKDFSIYANSANPLAVGIGSETSSNGNGTGNRWYNIFMNGTTTAIGKGWQFFIGPGGTDANNDNNVFVNCFVSNFATAAWSFEHGQSKGHKFLNSSFEGLGASSSANGVTTNLGTGGEGGSFTWYGGTGGGVGVDFNLGGTNDAIFISGWNSEASGRLLTVIGSSASWPVTLEGVRWGDGSINSDQQMIVFGSPCCLNLIGNLLGAGNFLDQIKLSGGSGTAINVVTSIGNNFKTSGTVSNVYNCQSTSGACIFAAQGNTLNGNTKMPDTFGHGPALATSALGAAGCGTGSPTITGDMNVFRMTCGNTSVTSWTITWPFTRTNVPTCSVTPETSAAAAGMAITTNSTTTLTVGWTTSTASTVWDVRCDGM